MTEEESRLKHLEDGHGEIQSSLTSINTSIDKLANKFESHVKEEQGFEETIRNIDDNVNNMIRTLDRLPFARSEAIEKKLDPVWDNVRKYHDELNEFKLNANEIHDKMTTNIKEDLRKEAKSHIALIWVGLIVITSLGGYIHSYQLGVITDAIKNNTTEMQIHKDKHE